MINILKTTTVLTKRDIVGTKYFSIFKGSDGINVETGIIQNDYGKLPTIPGGSTWKGDYGRSAYNTSDGELGATDYALDVNNTQYLVRIDGVYLILPLSGISGNKLTVSGLGIIENWVVVHNLVGQKIIVS